MFTEAGEEKGPQDHLSDHRLRCPECSSLFSLLRAALVGCGFFLCKARDAFQLALRLSHPHVPQSFPCPLPPSPPAQARPRVSVGGLGPAFSLFLKRTLFLRAASASPSTNGGRYIALRGTEAERVSLAPSVISLSQAPSLCQALSFLLSREGRCMPAVCVCVCVFVCTCTVLSTPSVCLRTSRARSRLFPFAAPPSEAFGANKPQRAVLGCVWPALSGSRSPPPALVRSPQGPHYVRLLQPPLPGHYR